MSHRSTATVALNKVKTQAADGLSTMTYCDMVTSPITWHPCDKQQTPAMASQLVMVQVGTVASSQSHPRSRSFHRPGNIHATSCTNHSGRREFTRRDHRRRDAPHLRSF